MPQVTIQTSGNLRRLDPDWLMLQVNRTLLNSGLFVEADLKIRVLRCDEFRIGADQFDPAFHGFVAATVAVLSGRDFTVRERLGQMVQRTVERCVQECAQSMQVQVTTEVVEIQPEMYFKTVLGGSSPA